MSLDSRHLDPIFILRGPSGFTCIQYGKRTNGGDKLFSGSSIGSINIWDLQQNRSMKVINGHVGCSILGIAQLDDGTILSHGRDGKIIHWNLDGSKESILNEINVYCLGFCSFSVLETGNDHLVGFQANSDSQVDVICLENKSNTSHLKSKEKHGMVMHIKLFTDANTQQPLALIGYEDGSIALWDISQQQMLSTLKLHNDPVMSLDLDSCHQKGISGSADDKLLQFSFDLKPEPRLVEIRFVLLKSKGISAIKIREDCKIVSVGCWDGRVRIFGWKKLKPLAVLKYHSETINSLAFSKDNILACGCKDGKISLWDIYSKD